jgi:hypothetical protein
MTTEPLEFQSVWHRYFMQRITTMRSTHTSAHVATPRRKNFDTLLMVLSALAICGVTLLYLAASGAFN